jgi:hypothetical protein
LSINNQALLVVAANQRWTIARMGTIVVALQVFGKVSQMDEQQEVTTDPMAEIKAMQEVAEAVTALDAEARGRVLRWAAERFGVSVGTTARSARQAGPGVSAATPSNGNGEVPQFSDIAELYAAATPESEGDKALVAGYWFQFVDGRPEFGSQEINSALKNLGHPIKNITSAFDSLKSRKPAPVMQVKKSGSTRQARKTYKLTVAGKSAVEMMIGQQQH